jgi:hypothetical protein
MTEVQCAICGLCWDSLDPGVRFIHGDGRWECWDEFSCFARRADQDPARAIGGYL